MTIEKIKKDLETINYYYIRKKFIDLYGDKFIASNVYDLLNKYKVALKDAPLKLYDIFCEIYIGNKTQSRVANEIGYTVEYVCKLNKKLLDYLLNYFNNSTIRAANLSDAPSLPTILCNAL